MTLETIGKNRMFLPVEKTDTITVILKSFRDQLEASKLFKKEKFDENSQKNFYSPLMKTMKKIIEDIKKTN
ncbi:MAG: hypothetical protein ACRBB2_05490 [Nitrosopumilus sp.]